jgi:hypothetical protein
MGISHRTGGHTRHFDWGRHETTPGWSAIRKLFRNGVRGDDWPCPGTGLLARNSFRVGRKSLRIASVAVRLRADHLTNQQPHSQAHVRQLGQFPACPSHEYSSLLWRTQGALPPRFLSPRFLSEVAPKTATARAARPAVGSNFPTVARSG